MPESATQQKQQIFVREATGLVKNVSFLDTIALNLSNMSVGPLLTTIAGFAGATFVIAPSVSGLNLVVASAIAFLLSVPQIVIYTIMSRRYPRAGGDYVYVSRNFGGFWGSTLSFWGYTMETLAFIALVALLVDFSIGGAGLSLGGSFSTWGLLFTNGTTQFVVAASIFAILIGINIAKPKAGYRLVTAITLFGVFSLLLTMGVYLAAGQTGVANYINGFAQAVKFGGSDSSYQALAASYTPSGLPFDLNFNNMIFIMPVIFAFVYPWLNAAPAVASEIKGSRALRWNVPISAFTGFLLLTGAFAVLYGVAGMPFVNAVFSSKAYAGFGLNFFSLAMGIAGGGVVSWIIGLGWIAMQLGTMAYAVIIFSRYLLAQSMDRFLPSKLAYVSPRFGSPVVAHLVDLVITLALIGITAYFFENVSGIFGAIIASMIYFVFIGLAATKHALQKEKGTTKVVLALAGIGNAIVFGFVSYQYLANPGFTGLNNVTYFYVIATFIAGALIYLGSRWYHKKRGIDISLNYKELPPE